MNSFAGAQLVTELLAEATISPPTHVHTPERNLSNVKYVAADLRGQMKENDIKIYILNPGSKKTKKKRKM